MSLPLVSIMMPAWNSGSYIDDAIVSCQDQTYKNWELCIVDDGSDDNTYQIALDASLLDSRIRIEQQYHQGCPVCGRMLRIGVRLLGQRVYCQHCGGGFRATDETLEEDEGVVRAIEHIQEDRIEMLLERATEAIGNSLKSEQSREEDIAQETA